MTNAAEQREIDRKRLEACERVEIARAAAQLAETRCQEAYKHARALGEEQSSTWHSALQAESELQKLLSAPANGERCATASTGFKYEDSVATSDDVKGSAAAKPAAPVAEVLTLTEQEANVWCMAYSAERGRLSATSKEARVAACEAVRAFREASKA